MLPDLRGIEFDWFAVDADGNLALFATAGEGFFPESVAEHHIDHSSLSDSLPTPRIGTPEVWSDYAALGLFVFDWALPGGPYEMRVSPACEVGCELKSKIFAISELPRFKGSFSGLAKMERWQ